jgi:hypothetical protein
MEDGFLLVSSFPALGATAESAGVDPMSASHPGSHVTSKRSLMTLLWPLIRPYRWLIAVALPASSCGCEAAAQFRRDGACCGFPHRAGFRSMI